YTNYCVTLLFAKTSIGLHVLRIAVDRRQRRIVKITMGLGVVTCLLTFFLTIFACHPVSLLWTGDFARGTCIDIDVLLVFGLLFNAFSILSDLTRTFALLPAWAVWHPSLPLRTKKFVIFLMTVGCTASCVAIVHLFFFMTLLEDQDFLYATAPTVINCETEQCLTINHSW
ncbi:hypothetical protein QBC46DRAFT_274870, partial [Diplogelasinospora grovesii]